MAPKSIFRQPGAKHFQLVHRSQRDPLIHDPDASQHVLKPVERVNVKKGKSRSQLEETLSPEELANDLSRANIGEASLYGVYFDDTEYDYMQHLRRGGVQEEGVEMILLEAPSSSTKSKQKSKGKGKDEGFVLELPSEALPSTSEMPRDYNAQQAIPSELTGLQPDMDPHLRQALEALEDDAFVDDGLEDDFFQDLVGGGERDEDEEPDFDFYEEGEDVEGEEGLEDEEGDGEEWEARFARFKRGQAQSREAAGAEAYDDGSEGRDTVGQLPALPVVGGKRRHKGTSDASGYSMSSSSMFRNEGLTLLDERFDQIEREYASDDDDDGSDDSDEAPQLITSREDFNAIMDDFLDNYEILGGKMKHTLPGETPTEKLAVIRQSLREINNPVLGDDDDDTASEEDLKVVVDEKAERWDCETILSTYSNLENHPRLIRAREARISAKILLDPKTGLPSVLPSAKDRKIHKERTIRHDEESPAAERPVTIARRKDETKDEKKMRKQAVKEDRQSRRVRKKATRDEFDSEKKDQLRILANMDKKGIRKL